MSAAAKTDRRAEFDQDAEPLLRIDIEQDLQTVRITRSDWAQAAYGQWTSDQDGRRVLRIEPVTIAQATALEDSIRAARLKYTAGLLPARAGGGR